MKNKYETIGWKVDIQEDFMNENEGKLALQNATSIVRNIEATEATLRQYKIPILGSMDWHKENSHEFPQPGMTPNFKETFPEHCIAETYGAQFIKEVQPINPKYVNWDKDYNLEDLTNKLMKHEGDIIFRKDAFDVFSTKGNKYTRDIIKNLNTQNAIVYGVALEVCNNHAIKGLINSGVKVYAVTDAMKAINENSREQILKDWSNIGTKLIKSEELPNIINTIYR